MGEGLECPSNQFEEVIRSTLDGVCSFEYECNQARRVRRRLQEGTLVKATFTFKDSDNFQSAKTTVKDPNFAQKPTDNLREKPGFDSVTVTQVKVAEDDGTQTLPSTPEPSFPVLIVAVGAAAGGTAILVVVIIVVCVCCRKE